MKMMPACSTRCTAVRLTDSMSTSFGLLLGDEVLERVRHLQPARLRAAPEHVAHHVLQVDANLLDRRAGDHLERRHRRPRGRRSRRCARRGVRRAAARASARACASACSRHAAVGPRPGVGGRVGGSSRSSSRSSAAAARLLLHLLGLLGAHHVDRELDEIAHHRLDVAADVADLGELRGLDLDERRLRQPRQPAGDLGLADAGRSDHQDVLRRDLLGHLGGRRWRRMRLRSAIATARLALAWPMTYLSSSATISRGRQRVRRRWRSVREGDRHRRGPGYSSSIVRFGLV